MEEAISMDARREVYLLRQVEGHSARRSVVMWLMVEEFWLVFYTAQARS